MNKNFNQKLKKSYNYSLFATEDHKKLNKSFLNQKLLASPSKDIHTLINNYQFMGNQAKKIYEAYFLIKNMVLQKNKIALSIATNILMSNRAYINWMIQNNLIDCFISTCGSFEEDIIHDVFNSHFFSDKSFWRGDSLQDDIKLKKNSINRAGDILIPNKYYLDLWKDIQKKLDFKKFNSNYSFTDLMIEILNVLNLSKNSVFKNLLDSNVPFFIPAPTDGALGDFILFEYLLNNKYYNPSLSKDYCKMAEFYIENQDNISVIALGGGTSKHHNLLHCIYAKGANKAVYINTSFDYDNSDSGGSPSEAITWGKLKTNAEFIKVTAEVSTCFPMIIEALRYDFK